MKQFIPLGVHMDQHGRQCPVFHGSKEWWKLLGVKGSMYRSVGMKNNSHNFFFFNFFLFLGFRTIRLQTV